MELLRFATAGSVDDGKSTLIGRLLYDAKSIFEDQMQSVADVSERMGLDSPNLALLTDGLRAEREQGITIDVAYRYFATPRRKFIIADTPGHTQYTRNMVTGASTADLAIVLIDARKGVLEQSRRHAFIASLLRIPHLVVAVNKMDLVDYSQDRFDEIVSEFRSFAAKLDVPDLTFVPISALLGDNVVARSENMDWYGGSSLLHHLETVHIASDRNLIDARFPVQYVLRPQSEEFHDYRGYAGRIAGGVFKPGDEVVVLPSGFSSRIARIDTFDGPVEEAFAPMSVTILLEDEIDISRGDMICRQNNRPVSGQDIDAMVCWMTEASSLGLGAKLAIKHTTRSARALVKDLHYRLDINTLHRDEQAVSLGLNEIGRVSLRTTQPLFFDEYRRNRETGAFILIDEVTNTTVAAGMILGRKLTRMDGPDVNPDVRWHHGLVGSDRRGVVTGGEGMVVWLTGLSGSGKSTVGAHLERLLLERGRAAYLLDGDNLRHGINAGLGFSPSDRRENVRRVGEVALLFADAGLVAVVPIISPYRAGRDAVRRRVLSAGPAFVEVHVATPLDICEARDPKGLYARARAGELTGMTGIDDPYEEPLSPDLVLSPSDGDALAQARLVLASLPVA